jgi:antitoxin component YwqK of YwqJK toxin-antitoxin module
LLTKIPPKSNSTYFFPDGNKYAELEVIDSFPNQIITYFDKENDKLTRTSFCKSDTLANKIYANGYYRQYHSSLSTLQSEGMIKNGVTQVEWKYYTKDGVTLKRTSQHKNYTIDGFQKLYYENGNLQEVNFQKKGLLHGPLKTYYENGALKNDQKYRNERLIDNIKAFDESGQLKIVQILHLDTITFKTKFTQLNYNSKGKLEATAFFENDASHIKTYYENGRLKERFIKINNKQENLLTTYHDNGNKMMEGMTSDGRSIGGLKFFGKSVKMLKTVHYQY